MSRRESKPEQGEPATSARSSDRGVTLIEMVVAITLVGMVVIAILAAIRTSITSSSIVYDAAELETVLLNAADRVDRAPQRCEYQAYAEAAALAKNWPASSVSATVELLVSNTGNPDADWAPQACPADVRAFDVQRVVITATTPNRGTTRSMIVVKSDVE